MIIIPAIDIKDGECVRLSRGDMSRATIYSKNPAEVAQRWQSLGAQRLHLVDLDGAVSGCPRNKDVVQDICSSVSMHIELGGGIRTLETIEQYVEAGVDSVILGTAAIEDPALFQESCRRYPGRIIAGIDARSGMVSVRGWTETSAVKAVDFARGLDSSAVEAIIFTDISRDGMLSGPNIDSTAELARSVSIPVIASGGISSLQDIRNLIAVPPPGIFGAVIGRALYTGDVDLQDCLRLTNN